MCFDMNYLLYFLVYTKRNKVRKASLEGKPIHYLIRGQITKINKIHETI